MAFWSVILPAKGKEVKQEVESTDSVLSSIHVTGLALGTAPKEGPHVITLEYNGQVTVLCTLEAPHTRQYHLDIALDETYKLRNLGDSEVHAYGFQVSTPIRSEGSDDEEDEDEEDLEEDSEGDSEDDEKTPRAIPLRLQGRRFKMDTPNGDLMDTDSEDEDEEDEEGEEGEEDEDEDEEEGEDESEEGIPDFDELGSDDLIGEAGEDESEEEEEEEGEEDEDEEEEEETEKEETPAKAPVKAGDKRVAQTPQPGKAPKQAKQEPPKSAPPKQLQQQKDKQGPRQIPVTVAGAETKAAKGKEAKPKDQPKGKEQAKGKEEKGKEQAKGKEEKGKAEKGKAEPPKGVKTPATEPEFRQALVDVLKAASGPMSLGTLGSAIKKPAAVTGKLSAYVAAHKELFAVDDKGVSLKK